MNVYGNIFAFKGTYLFNNSDAGIQAGVVVGDVADSKTLAFLPVMII